ATWIRASLLVPSGDLNIALESMAHPASSLPTYILSDQIALDLPIEGCGNIGANGLTVNTMASVGDQTAETSLSVAGSCASHSYTGGFIVTAAVQDGAASTATPETVVSVP